MCQRALLLIVLASYPTFASGAEREPLFLERGRSLPLSSGFTQLVESNERAITAVEIGHDGKVWAATTGTKAHLYAYDPATGKTTDHLAGLDVGVGLSHGIAMLRDSSVVWGTQRDAMSLAPRMDEKWLGLLQQKILEPDGRTLNRPLGNPVPGQGVYALAYVPSTDEVVGLTWPEGHFFAQAVAGKGIDHGPIAGHRTYETPRYADKINQGTGRKLKYARQVSRAIAIDPTTGAYTAGEDGTIFHYDPPTKSLNKLKLQLPAAAGRESFASWDAAFVLLPQGERKYTSIFGGTSDGYLFELRVHGPNKHELHSWGKPFAEPGIYGLVARETIDAEGKATITVDGLAGNLDGITRAFRVVRGPDRFELIPGRPPLVDGQPAMEPFSNIVLDSEGNAYAGELCRIGRLVKFSIVPEALPQPATKAPPTVMATNRPSPLAAANPLPCRVVFAPEGTTTEASGYTAIEMGRDGHVYVGSARYGDYAYLLRFPGYALAERAAQKLPTFMDKVVYLRDLTGEHRVGLNTQGKIHAKILAARDGRMWFATKQAHEVFGTRPEYEDSLGFPGGHLCIFDPAKNETKTLGILKPREGLMAGALDETRGKLYFRSEPRNHFLVYDIKSGTTRDYGNLGSASRYFAIDKQGAVWTFGRGPTICRYGPENQLVEDFPIRVEGEGEYTEPYVVQLSPDGKLYGLRGNHPSVMQFAINEFDPAARQREVVMRNVAPAVPVGLPNFDIHAAVFGRDNKLYWPLVTAEPGEADNKASRMLVLMRLDPTSGKSELVGRPQVEGLDEDQVRHTYIREEKYSLDHMQGACVSPDGTLYLMDIYPQLNVACFPKLTAK